MVTSQNGYTANDRSLVKTYRVPGTVRDLPLRDDAAGMLLVDFAAKFDKMVESIDHDGQLDDWGYAERPIRGADDNDLSNHASGTAVDLNALDHPLGARGTFTLVQVANIRALLEEYEGCIQWGGDYVRRADEMHFEIVKPLADCQRVLNRIRKDWLDMASRQEVVAAAKEAIWGIKIPVPPGSKAERAYGKGSMLSLPNAIYWSLAETTDDASAADVKALADLIKEDG